MFGNTNFPGRFVDNRKSKSCVRWRGRFHRHEWTEWLLGRNGLYGRHCTRCKQTQTMSMCAKLWGDSLFKYAMQGMIFTKIIMRRKGDQVKFLTGTQWQGKK